MGIDAAALLEICRRESLTLVTAESCTGGMIASRITAVPGSSDVFWGAFVSYANAAKSKMLAVPPSLIEEKGAVSREVVLAMVRGALEKSGADLALAVSGIAGPGGGSAEKPVGTVWLAAGRKGCEAVARCFLWKGARSEIRARACEGALELCKSLLLDKE